MNKSEGLFDADEYLTPEGIQRAITYKIGEYFESGWNISNRKDLQNPYQYNISAPSGRVVVVNVAFFDLGRKDRFVPDISSNEDRVEYFKAHKLWNLMRNSENYFGNRELWESLRLYH